MNFQILIIQERIKSLCLMYAEIYIFQEINFEEVFNGIKKQVSLV